MNYDQQPIYIMVVERDFVRHPNLIDIIWPEGSNFELDPLLVGDGRFYYIPPDHPSYLMVSLMLPNRGKPIANRSTTEIFPVYSTGNSSCGLSLGS